MNKILSKTGINTIIILVLSVSSCFFVVKALDIKFIQDDAFTSFRYAENFVNGLGLVFNEGERVEGYTNFLWVMILSGFYSLNKIGILIFDLENTAQFLSLFFGVAVIWITYFLSNEILNKKSESRAIKFLCIIPSYLMAFSGPLMYWSVSGMETSLFIFLTLTSFWLYIKNINKEYFGGGFIAVSFLNSLLRPEGLIFFGLIISYKLAVYIFENRGEKVKGFFNGKIRIELLTFLILSTIYLLFRFFYYGYFLPNTFYAKTEFSTLFLERGWRYFINFTETNLLYGVFLLLPMILFFKKETRKIFSFLIYIIITWILLVIFIGGDVLPVHRFFLTVLPIIFIVNIGALDFLISFYKNSIVQKTIAILVVIVIINYGFWNFNSQIPSIQDFRSYESGLVTKMKIYAQWIDDHMDETKKKKISVAMSTIGAFSFYSDCRIIDIVGLTDAYIAHNPKEVEGIDDELPVLWKERRYNADYVFSQKPDYIIFPAGAKPSAFAECALFVNKNFSNHYYVQLIYSRELNQMLPLFARRSNSKKSLIENDNNNCDVKFVNNYINAINLFLNMISKRNYHLVDKIISECDSVKLRCPERIGEAETIIGYTLYHSGKLFKAKSFFENSLQLDSLNMISRYYLRNIYLTERDTAAAIKQIRFIKKYSPGIFNDY